MKNLKDQLINESSANLCTFYGDKFVSKELGEIFVKFGEEIIKSKVKVGEIAIEAYKDSDSNSMIFRIRANDNRYEQFFNEKVKSKNNMPG